MSQQTRKTTHAASSVAAPISLHIERVVIEGGPYTAAQLGQLQGSLENELTSLLRTNGLPANGRTEIALQGRLPSRPASAIAQSPVELGRAMARSLYETLHSSGDRHR